ncbi:4-(cytidine 5'-diphospho)-2-C-methyl-D-erythritol kinase [Ectothiorhodospiraceae bacterium 2226]|nr:4-(cytidine 5'-diphospho)-2-C-methyl-D-erythritol kinase [Ectothiorhodospiraceae bacterium 2226]
MSPAAPAPEGAAWPAPAKLNLFLHITGRRADGYHTLQTVFQFLDLADTLELAVRQDGAIQRASELEGVAPDVDLVVRAARRLQAASGTALGVDIAVRKCLPMGAGLGGGSSDAATVLVALNRLWGLDWSASRLAELGLALGADVPVFVHGLAAWAEGVGERLSSAPLEEPWYVLLVPPVAVSTAQVFAAPELRRDCVPVTIEDFLSGRCANVFEPVVRARYPLVARALDRLGPGARLTGTGCTVFATHAEEGAARRQAAALRADIVDAAWQIHVTRGLNRSPLLERLAAAAATDEKA